MSNSQRRRFHYGPTPADEGAIGAEAAHKQIHDAAVGKTVARVLLGDDEPVPSQDDASVDFESEYLIFEFTDGTALKLDIGAGNSFVPQHGRDGVTRLLPKGHPARDL